MAIEQSNYYAIVAEIFKIIEKWIREMTRAKTEIWQGIPYDREWSKTLQSKSISLYTCLGTCSRSINHVKDELNRKSYSKMILVGYESIHGKYVTGYTATHAKEMMVWPGIRLEKLRDSEFDHRNSLTLHFVGKLSKFHKILEYDFIQIMYIV